MKKPFNRNFLWSKFFVDELEKLGVKYVCISPGSRNTPLTTAFSKSGKIKKFVIVDERSSAYFALGLAKQTGIPTAVVTTSGTATVNLYPAIVEAYQQRTPLIICTADRPAYLRGTGANQTINQDNLYANHIRYFADAGLPGLAKRRFTGFQKIIREAYLISTQKNRGPVHINFPFEKPLEESVKNEEVNETLIEQVNRLHKSKLTGIYSSEFSKEKITSLIKDINKSTRGIILTGWDNYQKDFTKQLLSLSKKLKYPVLVDGTSGLFAGNIHNNFIINHQAFLRSEKFINDYHPEIIIQFGHPPTSNAMLDFLENSTAVKYSISEFGDLNDPSRSYKDSIASEPSFICKKLIPEIDTKKDDSYLKLFQMFDEKTERLKDKIIRATSIKNEVNIIPEIINIIPGGSNLFISNSLPVRDLDFFKSRIERKLNIFVNRGASGIDGIISTAAGIASSSNNRTFLVTGDLTFFHDTNGLHTLYKYKIPLTIILINNGGGAIFGMLPVSKEKKYFEENFITPLNLNFRNLVKVYNGNFSEVTSANNLREKIESSAKSGNFSVLQIKTDYQKGITLRKKYFRTVLEKMNNWL